MPNIKSSLIFEIHIDKLFEFAVTAGETTEVKFETSYNKEIKNQTISVLKYTDEPVVIERIAQLLGRETLINLLNDDDSDLRQCALAGLIYIKDPFIFEPSKDSSISIFESIIATLKDEKLRDEAAKILNYITEKDFGIDHNKWQKWWEENKETFIMNLHPSFLLHTPGILISFLKLNRIQIIQRTSYIIFIPVKNMCVSHCSPYIFMTEQFLLPTNNKLAISHDSPLSSASTFLTSLRLKTTGTLFPPYF